MKILITGGAGFIGHHLVEHLLKNTEDELVLLDRLDTSGNLNRLVDLSIWEREKKRVKFVYHDLRAPLNDFTREKIGYPEWILHLAAFSHVDRSIEYPLECVMDNVVGTVNLLDYARGLNSLERFLYFSTDEVFGPAKLGVNYQEWSRYNSGNPYAASKAGAEELCLAYYNTYKLPVIITHTMNVFGERQHPEKFIPSTIRKLLRGEQVLVHADKTCTIPGSRFYIHARNVADAVQFVMSHSVAHVGDKYNIVGEKEVDNLHMAAEIARILGVFGDLQLVDFHSSRPGHDLRYALDGEKLKKMGWKIPVDFEASLTKTVRWYLDHSEWLGMTKK